MKWSTLVQDTFTYAKLVALFIIIGTGAYQLCTGTIIQFLNKTSSNGVSDRKEQTRSVIDLFADNSRMGTINVRNCQICIVYPAFLIPT